MEQHPAAEAPQMKIEADGTTRPETEQERIHRIQTAMANIDTRTKTEKAYSKPLPGSIELAEYLSKADFRPGDVVEVNGPLGVRTAEVTGRDRENIYVRYHDTNTQNRVHYTTLTMIDQNEGVRGDAAVLITPPANLPTREQAAAAFAEVIIQTADSRTPESFGVGVGLHETPEEWQAKVEAAEVPGMSIGDTSIEDLPPLLDVPIRLIHDDAQTPAQAKHGDAGYDLHSVEATYINAGGRRLMDTGVTVAIPLGYVGFIKPRSGLANKHGINVLGGVIDAGYRGELKVILHNTGAHPFPVNVGDRIAQLVIQPVAAIGFRPVDTLPDSERQHGGFGSTGGHQ